MSKKILKFTIIFVIVFSWVFGYPPVYENFWRARIWQNPPNSLDRYLTGSFPPKIQEARAAVEQGNAMILYGSGTTAEPKYRTWSSSTQSWSALAAISTKVDVPLVLAINRKSPSELHLSLCLPHVGVRLMGNVL